MFWRIVFIVSLVTTSSMSFAQSPSDASRDRLDRIIEQTHLIVRGRVRDIQYGVDRSGNAQTLVTWDVLKVYKGKVDESILRTTLPVGLTPNKHVHMASHLPFFNVGHEDFLFFHGEDPILVLKENRFRVFNSRVYDDNGLKVVKVEGDRIARGSAHNIKELMTFAFNEHEIIFELSKHEELPESPSGPRSPVSTADAMSDTEFDDILTKRLR